VDEYQDTNYLQSRLIDMLAREHGQLMVVGDDAQSIYSWRGADMENILSFTTRYPAAKTFKIETNYRSVPEILELSNAAIAANEVQIEKQLRSVRPTGEMPPALVPLNDDRMQAKFVVQRIRDLIEEGTDPSEIAVLYRAHFHSMELQMELTRGEIPFRITSGIRFFEQAHIKDVVAFMRFVVNPRDELSFRRMAMLLPGIGPGMAQKLWMRWTACPESRQETPPESFSALMLD
ncbi:MAG TPA: DNA helicase UvrD, partial [Akkermansia sp.]|nr:DNA helicase UvrD [Akkermansia sp.]